MLNFCKRNSTVTNWQNYVELKKQTSLLFQKKESEYYQNIQTKLGDVKNPTEFWKVIKSYKRHSSAANNISTIQWEEFYKTNMPPRVPSNAQTFSDATSGEFAKEITIAELNLVISKLKRKKSPGTD